LSTQFFFSMTGWIVCYPRLLACMFVETLIYFYIFENIINLEGN